MKWESSPLEKGLPLQVTHLKGVWNIAGRGVWKLLTTRFLKIGCIAPLKGHAAHVQLSQLRYFGAVVQRSFCFGHPCLSELVCLELFFPSRVAKKTSPPALKTG